MRRTITSFFIEENHLFLLEVKLELHGIFWFHGFAQPRDKYTHLMLPVIHNYPLTLSLLGYPGEAYASLSGFKTFTVKPEKVWEEHGFYVYPAIAEKIVSRMITFSIGGTGYIWFKPKTRASVPDFTTHQVFLPGTVFKTYIIADEGEYDPPPVIRLGSKRYGVFRVRVSRRTRGFIREGSGRGVTHPFNTRDVNTRNYHGILDHYAGAIAVNGDVEKILVAGKIILALPRFIGE